MELLNQAIARDPAFLLAYCRLAEAHDELYYRSHDHTPARLALANSAINAAFRLKPDSGEAHLARARHFYLGYFDYDHARDELAIAVRTLPNNAKIFEWTGFVDRRQGRWHEAVRNLQRATELDPRNFKVLGDLAVTYRSCPTMAKPERLQIASLPSNQTTIFPCSFVLRSTFGERADTRAVHAVIEKILRDDPSAGKSGAGSALVSPLREHDPVEADRGPGGAHRGSLEAQEKVGLTCAEDYWEGLIARMKGDTVAARVAFTSRACAAGGRGPRTA